MTELETWLEECLTVEAGGVATLWAIRASFELWCLDRSLGCTGQDRAAAVRAVKRLDTVRAGRWHDGRCDVSGVRGASVAWPDLPAGRDPYSPPDRELDAGDLDVWAALRALVEGKVISHNAADLAAVELLHLPATRCSVCGELTRHTRTGRHKGCLP